MPARPCRAPTHPIRDPAVGYKLEGHEAPKLACVLREPELAKKIPNPWPSSKGRKGSLRVRLGQGPAAEQSQQDVGQTFTAELVRRGPCGVPLSHLRLQPGASGQADGQG